MASENMSVLERSEKDAVADRAKADDFLAAANLADLHTLCRQMIDEREKIGKAFVGMLDGWAMTRSDREKPNQEAIDAIERVATQAIEFAREVIRQCYYKRDQSNG